jgi:hypothetical protein
VSYFVLPYFNWVATFNNRIPFFLNHFRKAIVTNPGQLKGKKGAYYQGELVHLR